MPNVTPGASKSASSLGQAQGSVPHQQTTHTNTSVPPQPCEEGSAVGMAGQQPGYSWCPRSPLVLITLGTAEKSYKETSPSLNIKENKSHFPSIKKFFVF